MLRKLILALMLAVLGTAGLAPTAEAQGGPRPHRGYRYRSTYRDFDRGFRHHYGYYETRRCEYVYNGGWTSYTCYDLQPNEYVYVQEQIMDDGRSRVTLYRDQDTKSPFVEYYVYRQRVERRHYWHHGHIHEDYVVVGYTESRWAINWESGWGKIFGGLQFAAIGGTIIANSGKGDDASKVVGGLFVSSGIVSSISGAKQLKEESDLEKAIAAEAATKADGTDVLN